MTSNSHQSKTHPENWKFYDTHRVLIVDDEPAILFAYRKLIEKVGMAVDISTNLEDAVKHIRKRHYLAVIADMRLTGTDNEDGLEFLRILRIECPATKMIIATGYGNSEIEKAAHGLGVSHFYEKPVQPSLILGALREFHAAIVCPPFTVPS